MLRSNLKRAKGSGVAFIAKRIRLNQEARVPRQHAFTYTSLSTLESVLNVLEVKTQNIIAVSTYWLSWIKVGPIVGSSAVGPVAVERRMGTLADQ